MAALVTAAVAVAVPASAQAAAFGSRTLKQGMSGSDVKTAQKLLIKTGESITADGAFGPATKRAVLAWEETAGLTPNGRIETTEAPTLEEAAEEGATARQTQPDTDATTTPATSTPTTTGTTPATGTTPTDATGGTTTTMGGATPTTPVGVPGETAVLNADGTATAPASAPLAVQQIIAAGNEIASKPYRYGGGHTLKWKDTGYDCSGSVSYALHGAGLLDSPLPSGNFETWGDAGPGQWVTIYANGGHMYMVVAGLRFDTSGAKPSRWQTAMRSSKGFVVRHPAGL
jgi:peptidoglycan hydrolase-like protein with peptidoglycan-binding domain